MAPIYVKGGVWTNIEDEILKAAVSKYGLNQWSRVSSLLTKKSAKQAKARWNEWLSPQINKSGWSREEDEKLLRLAKLMPNQWRTIAPIVGRTGTQCVERYQRLLEDAYEGGEGEDDLRLAGAGVESVPAVGGGVSGDLGLNPESRPAMPDEEDMDDEEREMLSEARARLANTKGKKAKRREREKMLDESKRSVLLQKRRELKAAGIKTSLESKNKKKRKEFDYNADIPHEREPVKGLYDVSEEAEKDQNDRINFDFNVARAGIDLDEKIPKGKNKAQKKNEQKEAQKVKRKIEGAAELINEADQLLLKKRKLELSAPQEGPGISEDEEDIDDKIVKISREIIERNKEKSSLIIDNQQVAGEKPRETAKTKQPTSAKKQKALREALKSLPPPTKDSKVILPSFDINEEQVVNTVAPGDNDQDTLNQLELLREVEAEEAKQRRSEVIQRNLSIPDPKDLISVNSIKKKLSPLEKEIAIEMHKLIKSDYSKYVDSTYISQPLQELDKQLYEKVHNQIESELKSIKKPKSPPEFALLHNHDIASKLLSRLNKYHEDSLSKEKNIMESTGYEDFEAKEEQLLQEIRDVFEEYSTTDSQLAVLRGVSEKENLAMKTRLDKLNSMIERLSKAEENAKNRLSSIRLSYT